MQPHTSEPLGKAGGYAGDHLSGPRADGSAYRRARRHSRTVRVLKVMLPVCAVAIVGGFVVATTSADLLKSKGVSVEGLGLSNGELTMNKPRMSGFDKNNRPFTMEARKATQNAKSPNVVTLDTIDARVPVGKDKFADVDAGAGVYDSKAETLTLSKDIKVRGMNGLDIDLDEAKIDMSKGSMETDKPVEVRSKRATINADSMRVMDSGKRILFKRRVKTVIHNSSFNATRDLKVVPTSTRPWIYTDKLSRAKFETPKVPIAPDTVDITGSVPSNAVLRGRD